MACASLLPISCNTADSSLSTKTICGLEHACWSKQQTSSASARRFSSLTASGCSQAKLILCPQGIQRHPPGSCWRIASSAVSPPQADTPSAWVSSRERRVVSTGITATKLASWPVKSKWVNASSRSMVIPCSLALGRSQLILPTSRLSIIAKKGSSSALAGVICTTTPRGRQPSNSGSR